MAYWFYFACVSLLCGSDTRCSVVCDSISFLCPGPFTRVCNQNPLDKCHNPEASVDTQEVSQSRSKCGYPGNVTISKHVEIRRKCFITKQVWILRKCHNREANVDTQEMSHSRSKCGYPGSVLITKQVQIPKKCHNHEASVDTQDSSQSRSQCLTT